MGFDLLFLNSDCSWLLVQCDCCTSDADMLRLPYLAFAIFSLHVWSFLCWLKQYFWENNYHIHTVTWPIWGIIWLLIMQRSIYTDKLHFRFWRYYTMWVFWRISTFSFLVRPTGGFTNHYCEIAPPFSYCIIKLMGIVCLKTCLYTDYLSGNISLMWFEWFKLNKAIVEFIL